MKKITHVCDHCGTEIDNNTGFIGIEISDFRNNRDVDLCINCYNEISDIVEKYVCKTHLNK